MYIKVNKLYDMYIHILYSKEIFNESCLKKV